MTDRSQRGLPWIDLASIAAIAVVARGLAHELDGIEHAGLLEHGFTALALREASAGFWSDFAERAAAAAATVLLAGGLVWTVRQLASRPRARRRVSAALRGLAVLALLVPVALTIAGALHGARRPPPRNVVIVVIDTLRADHLGLYGYDRGTSPNLDAFAERAFVFDRARSTTSWTLPAITSLLTSQYPVEHGVHREGERLYRGPAMLQQLARDRGLHAEAIVTQPHYRSGLDRDFDRFVFHGNRDAEAVYDEVLAFLDEHGDEPYFLLVHNTDPHTGYRFHEGFTEAPASSTLRHYGALLPAQGGGGIRFDSPLNRPKPLPPDQLAELVANYDGEIRYLDHHLARLLEALEARGALADTLVIVTADHGEEFFDHGSWWHGGSLHEELVRIPLIVWVPGLAPGRSDVPVSLVDVLPTVAEWLGVEAPRTARGRSLLPLVRGETLPPRPAFTSTGFRQWRMQQSVVDGGLKLIRREDGEFVGLFDLEHDPGERNDLGVDHPDRPRLEALLSAAGGEQPAAPPELDPEVEAGLRALGYLGEPGD